MNSETYLQRLTGKLIDAVDRLPVEFRQRHASWIKRRQNSDGGFSGREGDSDLYYTGFALRSLAVLQEIDAETCTRAEKFLRGQVGRSVSVVDMFSLVVSAFLVQIGGGADIFAESPSNWRDELARSLETCRHNDGGYAKAAGGTSGSTYTTFLVTLTLELLSIKLPSPERVVSFVQTRNRDGGFVEIPQMKRAGTNPTAAAIGILQVLGGLDNVTSEATIRFLLQMFALGEGGIRANDRIPAADLLSTFTGSWTLAELGGFDRIDRLAMLKYVESLQQPEGGFRGGLWDTGTDVEYTFYGIGTFGLLAAT